MTPNPQAQERIRRYLLGQLTDGAREEIEQDLLTNGELFEELLVVEDELIDEYLGGKLGPNERASFERHFLATTERHEKLRFGQAFAKYLSSQAASSAVRRLKPLRSQWAWTQTFFSSPLRIAACAIIVLGIALAIWSVFFRQSDVDKGLLALNAAYRDQRPVEARISALSYAPFSQTRGPGTERVNESDLRRAELTLLDALNKKPTSAVHHALGEVYLAKKQFDDAIREFEAALKTDPKNSQLLSDLGAAWLEKGKISLDMARTDPSSASQGNAIIELAQSLENTNKALKLEANLPEALFNRALYHQYMRLWQQEEDDWREYIRLDSNSQWTEEAKQRLKLIEGQRKEVSESKEEKLQSFRLAFLSHDDAGAWELVSSYHNRNGNLIVEQLMDAYLTAEARSENDEAKQNLLSLLYVGKLEAERAGDSFFSDLAQFYAKTGPRQQATLVRARTLMKSAHEGWGQSRVEESLDSFDQAKQLFERSDDPYESIVADYWISFCYYRQNETKESLAILEPLISSCENRHYFWLLARLFYLMSGVQFKLNEHSKAIDFATRAQDLAERTHDKVGMINALGSLMEFHRYLGNNQKALSYVQRGFGVVDSIALDPVQGARHYGFEAIALASAGLFAAAADYQRMALQFALQSGRSAAISSNYAFLGLTNWKLGNYDEALRNSRLAYNIALAHSNGPDDQNLMAYASLQTANAARLAGDFNTAIANYNRSIELYAALDLPTHLYQSHKGRLLCYIAEKNDELAKDEISTAISLAEKYRTKIFEENSRDNFFDTEQSIYDTAIEFEYSRMHNAERAFQYSENSHARSLLDLINTDTRLTSKDRELGLLFQSFSQPLPLTEIKLRLPPQVMLVQYAMLEDRLLTWVVSTEGVEAFNKNITERELTEKVLAFLTAASSKPGIRPQTSEPAARELFDILIGPIESLLSDKRQLCFVPDKVLTVLPFAALMSPSGRYLIQDQVIESAPSSTVFIMSTAIADQKAGRSTEKTLSVGNPAFDRDAYPLLDDLPSAAREAREVAKLYGPWNLLIENDATAASAKAEMEKSEVIHLAVHSVLDERFPLRSKLLFAKAKAPAVDTLSAYDVYHMKLPHTRLVVLSSCQTGAERYYKGEGMISLARPFIAARVPLVVASMWPVESDSTTEIMISFHKHRAQGRVSTAEALTEAQREMLRSSDERYRQPYYWAAFMVIGGYAKF